MIWTVFFAVRSIFKPRNRIQLVPSRSGIRTPLYNKRFMATKWYGSSYHVYFKTYVSTAHSLVNIYASGPVVISQIFSGINYHIRMV